MNPAQTARSGQRPRARVLFEAVAHAADRVDPFGAELAPQVANVNVDDVGARVEVVAPDVAEQLFAGEYLARVSEEHLREHELSGRQLHEPTVDAGSASAKVEGEVTMLEYRDLTRARRVAAAGCERAAPRTEKGLLT